MSTLRITIDIFSGRPNPVIELTARESREALGLLATKRRMERGEPGLPPEPTLGYRGLVVEQVGAIARGLPRTFRVAHDTIVGGRSPQVMDDDSFEQFVLSRARLRRLGLGRQFPKLLPREIARFRRVRKLWPWPPRRHKHLIARLRCRCAPLYEPAWWNDGGQRQLQNNCYNYGSNYRTDTFHQIPGGSQPGAAAGAMYTSLTGPAVRAAAIADGLIDSPYANNRCPLEGHLVALVIAPGIDFHWFRKGRTGSWTHKPGSTPVTNIDNSSQVILDPRTADRGMYTQFTTFMVVMHGHVKVK
jgi:hypothetical protein